MSNDDRFINESAIEAVNRRRRERADKELTPEQIEESFKRDFFNDEITDEDLKNLNNKESKKEVKEQDEVQKILDEPADIETDPFGYDVNEEYENRKYVEKHEKSNALKYILVGAGCLVIGGVIVYGLKGCQKKTASTPGNTRTTKVDDKYTLDDLLLLGRLKRYPLLNKTNKHSADYIEYDTEKTTYENATGNIDQEEVVVKDGVNYENQESADNAPIMTPTPITKDEYGGTVLSNGYYMVGGSLFESKDLFIRFINGEASLEDKDGVYVEYVETKDESYNADGTYTVCGITWESKELYDEVYNSETPVAVELVDGVYRRVSKTK